MANVLLHDGPLGGQWVKAPNKNWPTIVKDGCVYHWDGEKYAYESGEATPEPEVKVSTLRTTRRGRVTKLEVD